ncbi:phage tail fiber protein [Acinetobacter baumannii]
MTIQTVNLGSAPTGAGGDTFRSTGAKMNENFTNWSHAASRYVGSAAGNLMEVGAYGLGGLSRLVTQPNDVKQSGLFHTFNDINMPYCAFLNIMHSEQDAYQWQIGVPMGDANLSKLKARIKAESGWSTEAKIWNQHNTTVDSNGFIKAASPIVKLFAEKIELNEEAAEQPLSFEKLGIGHYLVKGSSGFAKEGWWIEIPTDTHGNKICAVEYQTLENGDLEIKTFKKKLNDEGDIVANLDAPIDIPNNANNEPRWIDIRLNTVKRKIIRKVPRTEKQPRMVQQIKYSMQPTFMTRLTELIDDDGKVVMVDGKPFQKKETYLVTDSSGMVTLTKQPVINENGEPVLEWIQAVDSEGNPVFDDVPVLDKDGNPIYDEVTYDPE